jgi:hypothetical protein
MRNYDIYAGIPSYNDFVALENNQGDDRLIFPSRHGDSGLVVFKYSKAASFSRTWNDITVNARGIIFDDTAGDLICLPFKKFFNLGETNDHRSQFPEGLSLRDAEVLFKEDGSMICVFLWNDRLMTSTPGSTNSEQSQWAKEWIENHPAYDSMLQDFRDGKYRCLIFEAVYPGSKVVLEYEKDELILIAGQVPGEVIENSWVYATHDELLDIGEKYNVSVTRIFKFDDMQEVVDLLNSTQNMEGFVLHFPSCGFRVKVKSEWYVNRHRILGRIHPNMIFDLWNQERFRKVTDFDTFINEALSLISEMEEEHRAPFLAAIHHCQQDHEEYINNIVTNYNRIVNSMRSAGADPNDQKLFAYEVNNSRLPKMGIAGQIFQYHKKGIEAIRQANDRYMKALWDSQRERVNFKKFTFNEEECENE